MTGIVAKILFEDGVVIPTPYKIETPSDTKDIIVSAVSSLTDFIRIRKLAFLYYGESNCRTIQSKMVGWSVPFNFICVSSQCILNKIKDPNCTFPGLEISPVWQDSRFGMTIEEAEDLKKYDAETNYKITKYKKSIEQEMKENLKIYVNKELLSRLRSTNEMFDIASVELDHISELYERDIANQVAHFIKKYYDVEVRVDGSFVFFQSSGDVVLDRAITEAFSIGPEKTGGFFNESSYDACIWPIVSVEF